MDIRENLEQLVFLNDKDLSTPKIYTENNKIVIENTNFDYSYDRSIGYKGHLSFLENTNWWQVQISKTTPIVLKKWTITEPEDHRDLEWLKKHFTIELEKCYIVSIS